MLVNTLFDCSFVVLDAEFLRWILKWYDFAF